MKEILKLCPAETLVSLYKVPSFDSVEDFLHKVATVRGRLKKGGIVDVEAAARIVLHDWNEGIHTILSALSPSPKFTYVLIDILDKKCCVHNGLALICFR